MTTVRDRMKLPDPAFLHVTSIHHVPATPTLFALTVRLLLLLLFFLLLLRLLLGVICLRIRVIVAVSGSRFLFLTVLMLDASSGPLENFLEALRDVTFAATTFCILVIIVVIVTGSAAQESAEL